MIIKEDFTDMKDAIQVGSVFRCHNGRYYYIAKYDYRDEMYPYHVIDLEANTIINSYATLENIKGNMRISDGKSDYKITKVYLPNEIQVGMVSDD